MLLILLWRVGCALPRASSPMVLGGKPVSARLPTPHSQAHRTWLASEDSIHFSTGVQGQVDPFQTVVLQEPSL